MCISVPGFEEIRHEYPDDKDFSRIYTELLNGNKPNIRIIAFMMATNFGAQNFVYRLPPSVNILCRNDMRVDVADTLAGTRLSILLVIGTFGLK